MPIARRGLKGLQIVKLRPVPVLAAAWVLADDLGHGAVRKQQQRRERAEQEPHPGRGAVWSGTAHERRGVGERFSRGPAKEGGGGFVERVREGRPPPHDARACGRPPADPRLGAPSAAERTGRDACVRRVRLR